MSDLSPTEGQRQSTRDLDARSTREAVALLVLEQRAAFDAVAAASDDLADAVEAMVVRVRDGGRVHYVGAGSSGRLGVLDASEIPPTFGVPDLFCAHIAGGDRAIRSAVEGAEDDGAAASSEMRTHVHANDVVIGVSAGGNASYVLEALRTARANGALTVALVNNDRAALLAHADHRIVLRTGAEAVAGSTRLAAGTAQKIALNALSTGLMVRLGKVYDNLMVDVVASNEKLRARALRLVRQLTGLSESESRAMLAESGGNVKRAVVMARRRVSAPEAARLLEEHHGHLRPLM